MRFPSQRGGNAASLEPVTETARRVHVSRMMYQPQQRVPETGTRLNFREVEHTLENHSLAETERSFACTRVAQAARPNACCMRGGIDTKRWGAEGAGKGGWKRYLISETKPGLENLLHEPPFAFKVLRDIIVIGRQDLFDGYVDSKVAP